MDLLRPNMLYDTQSRLYDQAIYVAKFSPTHSEAYSGVTSKPGVGDKSDCSTFLQSLFLGTPSASLTSSVAVSRESSSIYSGV